MAHLSLALPVAILALPLVVLVALRVAAAIADEGTRKRSARVLAAIEKSEPAAPRRTTTSVSSLTEDPERDQG